ncbi:hypothetical protein BDV95DRAFT_600928 [Massariosphaeria phaeospora]|uniref:Uncharacterized protein n=1 Tax=Massariosphaeria phaeospora TaxID=100035 RepID=A0A7C8MJD2_9PLEO|nr:hypothetical protein BDV95DRAFT_600928 [Massariosphaeria phaeospora]
MDMADAAWYNPMKHGLLTGMPADDDVGGSGSGLALQDGHGSKKVGGSLGLTTAGRLATARDSPLANEFEDLYTDRQSRNSQHAYSSHGQGNMYEFGKRGGLQVAHTFSVTVPLPLNVQPAPTPRPRPAKLKKNMMPPGKQQDRSLASSNATLKRNRSDSFSDDYAPTVKRRKYELASDAGYRINSDNNTNPDAGQSTRCLKHYAWGTSKVRRGFRKAKSAFRSFWSWIPTPSNASLSGELSFNKNTVFVDRPDYRDMDVGEA